jgi:hypothetical protein
MGTEQEAEVPTAPLPDHVSRKTPPDPSQRKSLGKSLNTLNKLQVVPISWWSLGEITGSGPGESVTQTPTRYTEDPNLFSDLDCKVIALGKTFGFLLQCVYLWVSRFGMQSAHPVRCAALCDTIEAAN